MEIFSVVVKRCIRQDGDKLYMEFEPENMELKDVCYHGMTLPIQGSVKETIAAYAPTAEAEIFKQIELKYPGRYQIA